jgi:hypothetical protein
MTDKDYKKVREAAQKLANATGHDYGISYNVLFKTYSTRMLPQRQNRYDRDLTCEVVSCEDLERCKPGYGPKVG